jgi:hypothetical protein
MSQNIIFLSLVSCAIISFIIFIHHELKSLRNKEQITDSLFKLPKPKPISSLTNQNKKIKNSSRSYKENDFIVEVEEVGEETAEDDDKDKGKPHFHNEPHVFNEELENNSTEERRGKLICDGKEVDSEIIYWKIVPGDKEFESPITPHHG